MNLGFWPSSVMWWGWDRTLPADGWVSGHDSGTLSPKNESPEKLCLIHLCAPRPEAGTQTGLLAYD